MSNLSPELLKGMAAVIWQDGTLQPGMSEDAISDALKDALEYFLERRAEVAASEPDDLQ